MALHMSEEEYAAFLRRTRTTVKRTAPVPPREDQKRKSKYGNQRVEVDGMKFDSKHEAAVYQQLLMRVKAGELRAVISKSNSTCRAGLRTLRISSPSAPTSSLRGSTTRKARRRSRTGCTSTKKADASTI